MSEWWTYRPADFLLFSPRTYWRLFELHNETLWPLHLLALLAGLAVLYLAVRPAPWSSRAIAAVLAAAWALSAGLFLWQRYAPINWAAVYAVPLFALEALLLLWFGTVRNSVDLTVSGTVPGIVGAGTAAWAVFLHPFVAVVAGRPVQGAEVFALTPDPTAMATLGLLAAARPAGRAWLLIALPLLWCLASGLTLVTMGAWEAWVPLLAVLLGLGARLWRRAS